MFDRSKLLLSVFGVPETLYTDEAFADLKNLGPDYIMMALCDPRLIALCEKYDISLLVSGRVSCGNTAPWSSGDGDNAGASNQVMPLSLTSGIRKTPDSPAIAGDYLVDEPSSQDFEAINEYCREYRRLYPGKLPMINLYPNYASVAETTDSQRVSQLGTATYREYIDRYIQRIDVDYLSMDYYPFHGDLLSTYIDNLRVCGDACRDNGRDFWYIFQAGAWTQEEQIAPFQLRWQCYLAMAFGARALQAACYHHAWWHPACGCVDSEGRKNPMYDWVRDLFRELRRLGDAYMPYRYTGAYRAGDPDASIPMLKRDLAALPECGVTASEPAVVGKLQNAQGRQALMLVNCRDPWNESAEVKVTVPADRIRLWRHGYTQILTGDGKIRFTLAGGEGALAELDAD